jgi:hypothetical protein
MQMRYHAGCFALVALGYAYRGRGLYGRGAGAEGKSTGPLDCLEGSSRHDH